MSTLANTNKMSSSHRTSNNYYDNQRDDLMDTDDLSSSEQSDVVSMVSEIATDTDVTSSEDDNDHDSISCSFSQNLAKSYVGAPQMAGAPSYGKSWIHP